MNKTVGFIGTGNMGGALAAAAAKALPGTQIVLYDKNMESAKQLAEKTGCHYGSFALAASCDFIFLGVKPQIIPQLMQDLKPALASRKDRFVLVSMAAGVSMERIQELAGRKYPVIRIMPNTPVAVGGGMILYDSTETVSCKELEEFRQILSCAGRLDPLPEKLIDAGSAVSGCGPAFACLFIEALADGGVACGLPRDKALRYAQQMLLGTAQLALQTGQHPGQLKDAVCSPGGSTIAGVQALEEGAFRAAVISAVQKAFARTVELGK